MNQVALVGNIADDPKLRYTQSGAILAASRLQLATGASNRAIPWGRSWRESRSCVKSLLPIGPNFFRQSPGAPP
jgi:single-stranded DNA-binding protein